MNKLFQVRVEVPNMYVLAEDEDCAKEIAQQNLDLHLKNNKFDLWWIFELNKELSDRYHFLIRELKAVPYGSKTNRTVARIVMNDMKE